MHARHLAYWRMHNLGLIGERFGSPEDVVRWMGAMQAQEFMPAKWAIAQRINGFDDTALQQAFDAGQLLRTHALRPTWHFVLPEDIRLVLQVTGPRVQVANGHMYRRFGLDAATFDQCNQIIVDTLSGGNHLTRKEIGVILAEYGIDGAGTWMAGIMMNAELEGIVCSGAMQGKQQTYALIEERAPNARRYEPDEALAEFIRRYFTSHGPATVKDCRAWASLKIADIRRGIAMLGDELQSFEHAGLTYWYAHDPPGERPPSPHVRIVQGYDEYFMGYLESRGVIDCAGRLSTLNPDAMIANGSLLIDSQVAGHWRRKQAASTLALEIFHYEEFDGMTIVAIEAEASRFGTFLGMEATVEFTRL